MTVIGISRIIQEVALPLISLPHKGGECVKLKNARIFDKVLDVYHRSGLFLKQ